MPEENVYINESTNSPEITAKQISESYSGEVILIKASHALGAERIITEIKKIKANGNM